MYVDVLVHKTQVYTYFNPYSDIGVGNEVEIPFRHATTTGFVIREVEKPAFETRSLIQKTSPTVYFTSDLVALAQFISDYYCCYFASAIKTILPKD